MAQLSDRSRRLARFSLVALWVYSALASVLELDGQSALLLASTSLPDAWHVPAIIGGAALDLLVGIALWRWHRQSCYRLAGAQMLALTLAATCLVPGLWLDPLGSLAKNMPIAALLWMLHEDART